MVEIDLFGFKYLSGLTDEEIEKLLKDIDSDDYDGDNDYGIERVINNGNKFVRWQKSDAADGQLKPLITISIQE